MFWGYHRTSSVKFEAKDLYGLLIALLLVRDYQKCDSLTTLQGVLAGIIDGKLHSEGYNFSKSLN